MNATMTTIKMKFNGTHPLAAKLRKLADALPEKIENLRRPLSQNSTPKRQREYTSRVLDGDNLERGRLALLALAVAWDAGTVPEILRGLKAKNQIVPLVRHGQVSNGYYHVASSHEYANKTPEGKALQQLLDESLGTHDHAALAETKRKRDLEAMTNRVRFSDIPGFFPTPKPIISLMLAQADLRPGLAVLEPSAGLGSICDELRLLGIEPVVCEINYSLRDILTAKGYKFVGANFLETTGSSFDRIVMNPPFERGQDIEHTLHAWKLLKDDGILVSIVSAGAIYRQDKQAIAFCAWLEMVGAEIHDLPAGSFDGAQAFRATGVASKMIVAHK